MRGHKKLEILKFELGEKLDRHFKAKFHGESNGDSLDALKRCLDPELGHQSLIWDQESPNLKFNLRKKLCQHFVTKFTENRMVIISRP